MELPYETERDLRTGRWERYGFLYCAARSAEPAIINGEITDSLTVHAHGAVSLAYTTKSDIAI